MTIFSSTVPAAPKLKEVFHAMFARAATADLHTWPDHTIELYRSIIETIRLADNQPTIQAQADVESEPYTGPLIPAHRGELEILGYRIDFMMEIVIAPLKDPFRHRGNSHEAFGKVSFVLRGDSKPFICFYLDQRGVVYSDLVKDGHLPKWTADLRQHLEVPGLMIKIFEAFLESRLQEPIAVESLKAVG